MPDLQLARLQDSLAKLKLFTLQTRLETLLQEASTQEVTYADFLDRLLAEELVAKSEKYVAMRTVMARFPYRKTLESFDFSFQPSLDRQKLQELATGRFIEHGDHGVFLGPPGTGKTHVAMALGLKAVQQGYRTLFTAALPLIAALTKAYAENRLEERLKQYCLPKLLIIDEIGYIPIDRHGAHLFFQLMSRRYARGAIMLTSNQSFGQWAEVFGDPIIATAVLDRLLHHSHVLNMKGDSYRLKEKQQAGLLKNVPASDPV
jgi:DNA replication protein DnaC